MALHPVSDLVVLDSLSSKPAALLLFEMMHPVQTLTATDLKKGIPDLGTIPEWNLSSQSLGERLGNSGFLIELVFMDFGLQEQGEHACA